jgi:hypothetical protein
MTEPSDKSVADRRTAPRLPFQGQVRVEIATEVRGSGQNISESGLSFFTQGKVEVLVHVEGRDEPLRGELVRLTPTGNGSGMAVRFLPDGPQGATRA